MPTGFPGAEVSVVFELQHVAAVTSSHNRCRMVPLFLGCTTNACTCHTSQPGGIPFHAMPGCTMECRACSCWRRCHCVVCSCMLLLLSDKHCNAGAGWLQEQCIVRRPAQYSCLLWYTSAAFVLLGVVKVQQSMCAVRFMALYVVFLLLPIGATPAALLKRGSPVW